MDRDYTKPKFNGVRLAKKLMAEFRPSYLDGRLDAHVDGEYVCGREFYGYRITVELGDDWTRARSGEVLAYIEEIAKYGPIEGI